MEQGTIQILFALLRSAVFGTRLSEEDKTFFYKTPLSELITLSKKHDVTHLLAHGLKENGLIPQGPLQVFSVEILFLPLQIWRGSVDGGIDHHQRYTDTNRLILNTAFCARRLKKLKYPSLY